MKPALNYFMNIEESPQAVAAVATLADHACTEPKSVHEPEGVSKHDVTRTHDDLPNLCERNVARESEDDTHCPFQGTLVGDDVCTNHKGREIDVQATSSQSDDHECQVSRE